MKLEDNVTADMSSHYIAGQDKHGVFTWYFLQATVTPALVFAEDSLHWNLKLQQTSAVNEAYVCPGQLTLYPNSSYYNSQSLRNSKTKL